MNPATSESLPRLMRAATFAEPERIEIQEIPIPAPAENQALVRIEGCGVCASNLPPWEGRPWFEYPMKPGQPGHEAWGEVVTPLENFLPGQKVATLSQNAYAEFDLATTNRLIPLPPQLAGQPFPGEPLGCAINIHKRSGIQKGDTVAIIGIGFLGALLVQLAAADGARVLALTRRKFALDLAEKNGAAETMELDDHWRIIEKVRELTGGKFCDVVIEATGKQWPLDLAGELTTERGRLVIAGYHQDGPREVNMQLWNWRGLDVINAHERDPEICKSGVQTAVEAASAGKLDPLPLLTHQFPLEELAEALDLTRRRPEGFMKAWIKM